MPPLVRAAVVLMIAAFAFYSFGVWAVFLTRRLRPWHAGLFWLGFLSDTAGTELMRRLAGGFHWTLHTATGGVALLLMLAHAVWATIVLINRAERPIRLPGCKSRVLDLFASFSRLQVVCGRGGDTLPPAGRDGNKSALRPMYKFLGWGLFGFFYSPAFFWGVGGGK